MKTKLLLVEDAQDLANAFKQHLEGEGYIVDHVSDGASALDRLSNFKYDLMLLDINLPKLNGFEVAKAVNELDYKIPIIAVTARDGIQDKLQGFELGFDDYVTKPFDMREITARIKAISRRKDEADDIVLCFEDVKVDLKARKVTVDDDEVSLTKLEFDLLKLLSQKAPAVVENQEIIDELWGDEDVLEPPIRSHIKNLRKKINDDEFTKIVTIPGVGYKIEEVNEC